MIRIRLPKRRLTLAATAVLAVVVLVITYGALRGGPTAISAVGPINNLEVELITLRPAGFEPSEINKPKGPFVLFIDDRSGKQNSILVLQRVNGERVRAISLNRKESEWHEVIDLPPGTYIVHDQNNSEWRCQITILP